MSTTADKKRRVAWANVVTTAAQQANLEFRKEGAKASSKVLYRLAGRLSPQARLMLSRFWSPFRPVRGDVNRIQLEVTPAAAEIVNLEDESTRNAVVGAVRDSLVRHPEWLQQALEDRYAPKRKS